MDWTPRCPKQTAGRLGRALAAVAALSFITLAPVRQARAGFAPEIAIIMCKDTYAADWYAAHSSSQALVGLAGLVGVPYRTSTLQELLAEPDPGYTSLWFSACVYVAEERIGPLADLLQTHVDAGGSVFLDGPLGIGYHDADDMVQYRSMAATFPFLGIEDGGWYDIAGHAVHTTASEHPIAARAGHAGNTALTQGIPYGTETVALTDPGAAGSQVLLELVGPDGIDPRPYLAVAEPASDARVLAVGTYGTYVGPASPFRNDPPPEGFYDNQLLPYLVHALAWLVGPEDEPFIGLQLSHAPMTVIARLDGDWSNEPEGTTATLDYLNELARRTGVTTVYGIVSSFADSVSWSGFRPGADELQALGGTIGTHSRTHNDSMSDQLDAAGWADEVAGSLDQIRAGLTSADFTPDAYAFINPGNTIQSRDYGQFFADIDLYMTHGFETATPYASGVMGFDLPAGVAPTAVVNNTPAPDFQWLYLPGWVYTVEQAAAFQAMLLDYYQNTVGRGVLYNQMWHDYALSDLDAPLNFPDAPTMRPLFDANLQHFEDSRVYAPSARELVAKMHIAHKVALSSALMGDELVATLDYAAVPEPYLDHVAGMGVRIHAASQPVRSVLVDGMPHHAFTSDTVLLPAAATTQHTLTIRFGPPADSDPRLTYLSKPPGPVERQGDTLTVWLQQPGLAARFCVAAPLRTVILRADAYRRTADDELCGRVAYGTATQSIAAQALDTGDHDIAVVAAERAISAAGYQDHTVTLEVAAGDAAAVDLESDEQPLEVRVDDTDGEVTPTDSGFAVALPASTEPLAVTIRLPAPCTDCPDDQPEPAGCGCVVAPHSRDHGLPAWLVLLAGALLARRIRHARRVRR